MPLETIQMGRYRILKTIGSGSMGEVYLVEDTRINRQVAIKVIRTEGMSYPDSDPHSDAARLFEREAKAIARLNHPSILPLYDFGEEIVNGTPLTYMVMPYCPDGSLASWLQQRGPSSQLSLAEVEHFGRQAGDALQHAHDNGIIHQDVKPQNFLLRSNKSAGLPDLLLADFGIAKLALGTSGASQAIRGTPIYMAPEQWEGNPLPASDQYALAIMLYILLTGRPPFEGGPGQMMYQHFSVVPQPPSALNPAINPGIDAVILHALAKKPQERYPSVADFSHAFQQAALVDAPTFMQEQSTLFNRSQAGSISAPLTISAEEALNGTVRQLTLAGGRRVRVVIPPHTQNGQVIQAIGQDLNGGAAIPLLLAMSVASAPENIPTLFNDAGTIAGGNRIVLPPQGSSGAFNDPNTATQYGAYGSNPKLAGSPGGPYYNQTGFNNNAPPYARNTSQGPAGRGRSRTGLTVAIVALALLIVFGSIGAIAYFSSSTNAKNSANATSTALSKVNASATAQNNSASTAQANAQASNTAQSQSNAKATATANANATAAAGANATATANSANNANATATAATAATATATNTPTLTAPTQTAPPNGTVFPAGTTSAALTWSAVQGAASYTVVVEKAAGGTTCGGGAILTTQANITATSYTFAFNGSQPDCWRVWAVDGNGRAGPKSSWWEFSYTAS